MVKMRMSCFFCNNSIVLDGFEGKCDQCYRKFDLFNSKSGLFGENKILATSGAVWFGDLRFSAEFFLDDMGGFGTPYSERTFLGIYIEGKFHKTTMFFHYYKEEP